MSILDYFRTPAPTRLDPLMDVALHMKTDDGLMAPNVLLVMRYAEFERLAEEWEVAIEQGWPVAGHYDIQRNGAPAQVGIVISNIRGFAAVPHVPVVVTDGDK